MATINQAMQEMMTCDGALCAALVDSSSGMILGQIGSGVDLEVAAAGNTEVVRAKMKTYGSQGRPVHLYRAGSCQVQPGSGTPQGPGS